MNDCSSAASSMKGVSSATNRSTWACCQFMHNRYNYLCNHKMVEKTIEINQTKKSLDPSNLERLILHI